MFSVVFGNVSPWFGLACARHVDGNVGILCSSNASRYGHYLAIAIILCFLGIVSATLISEEQTTKGYQYELTICAIFYNEGSFLFEWITHHHCKGVEHFFLFNDNSDDESLCVLEPFVREGIVTISNTNTSKGAGAQKLIFNACLSLQKQLKVRWTAFIDIDEYIFTPAHPETDIPSILEKYADYAALQVAWLHFSDAGRTRSDEFVLEKYQTRESDTGKSVGTKSIVQPRYVERMSTHFPYLVPNSPNCTDEKYRNLTYKPTFAPDKRACSMSLPSFVGSEIRLNHYMVKSREHFICRKSSRPNADKVSKYRFGGKSKVEAMRRAETGYLKFLKLHCCEHDESGYKYVQNSSCMRKQLSHRNHSCKVNTTKQCVLHDSNQMAPNGYDSDKIMKRRNSKKKIRKKNNEGKNGMKTTFLFLNHISTTS